MRTMAAVTAWRDAFIERLKATGNVTLAATGAGVTRRLALLAFKDRYNQAWLVERHGHRHPGSRPPGALAEHRSGRVITERIPDT